MIGTRLPSRFAWHPSHGRQHRSDVLHLAPWAERRVDVVIDDRQVVLLLRDHAVAELLESGVQPLSVGSLAAGWARPRDEAARADRVVEGCLPVCSSDLLLYIPTGTLPELQWRLEGEDLCGNAQIGIVEPVRYYDSFLRNSEDLEEQAFLATLETMLCSVISRWLEQRGGGYESASPALAEELRIAASAALASTGLELHAFDCQPLYQRQLS